MAIDQLETKFSKTHLNRQFRMLGNNHNNSISNRACSVYSSSTTSRDSSIGDRSDVFHPAATKVWIRPDCGLVLNENVDLELRFEGNNFELMRLEKESRKREMEIMKELHREFRADDNGLVGLGVMNTASDVDRERNFRSALLNANYSKTNSIPFRSSANNFSLYRPQIIQPLTPPQTPSEEGFSGLYPSSQNDVTTIPTSVPMQRENPSTSTNSSFFGCQTGSFNNKSFDQPSIYQRNHRLNNFCPSDLSPNFFSREILIPQANPFHKNPKNTSHNNLKSSSFSPFESKGVSSATEQDGYHHGALVNLNQNTFGAIGTPIRSTFSSNHHSGENLKYVGSNGNINTATRPLISTKLEHGIPFVSNGGFFGSSSDRNLVRQPTSVSSVSSFQIDFDSSRNAYKPSQNEFSPWNENFNSLNANLKISPRNSFGSQSSFSLQPLNSTWKPFDTPPTPNALLVERNMEYREFELEESTQELAHRMTASLGI
jgi:hypothetical protein